MMLQVILEVTRFGEKIAGDSVGLFLELNNWVGKRLFYLLRLFLFTFIGFDSRTFFQGHYSSLQFSQVVSPFFVPLDWSKYRATSFVVGQQQFCYPVVPEVTSGN